MEPYTVREDGEKVLPGSRRPDGTIRKERRIRAGYTPQDEQPTYQSTGAMVRQELHVYDMIEATFA
jgi:partner of Y14 and mago protein